MPDYRTVPRKPTISSFRFIDDFQDKVGRGFQGTPNNDPDAHFRIVIDPQGLQRRVTAFLIYASDARGNHVYSTQLSQGWSTTGDGWVLGVETAGKRLNPTADSAVSHLVDTATEFDLFGDLGRGSLRGEYVTVVVRFSDGARISSTTRVE